MITLDEVIKALEMCLNSIDEMGNCNGECSYIHCCNPEASAVKTDALHYLKEYRNKAHKLDIDIAEHHRTFEQLGIEIARYQKAKAEMEEISADYVALKQWWTEQQVNPPLSWDELKAMKDKPVWVEEIEDDKILFGQWDIISGFSYSENFDLINYENPIIDFYKSGNRTKFGLGKTWQAYRRERE